MNKIILQIISWLLLSVFITGCARDLSSNVYASDSTLSLTLEGKVIAVRAVTVKNHDKLGDNTGGILAGGATGAVLGSTAGSGSGTAVAVVGGALAGAALGSVMQDKLGQKSGYEYIVKVDTSKLKSNYYEGNAAMRSAISTATTSGVVTIVQGTDTIMKVGQKVYVIFSDDRTRVIPVN
jgi:outer membrane lipoprotein SlyB